MVRACVQAGCLRWRRQDDCVSASGGSSPLATIPGQPNSRKRCQHPNGQPRNRPPAPAARSHAQHLWPRHHISPHSATRTSSVGLWLSTGTFSILRTTSIDSESSTRPKITCLPAASQSNSPPGEREGAHQQDEAQPQPTHTWRRQCRAPAPPAPPLTIQPVRLRAGDVKLAAVGVGPTVRHRQEAGRRVPACTHSPAAGERHRKSLVATLSGASSSTPSS